jgi:hypothetical protein
MKRENRYTVLKNKDICDYLSVTERKILFEITDKINMCRIDDSRPLIDCVVVESDWPEYEPTWAAIEKRVDTNLEPKQEIMDKNETSTATRFPMTGKQIDDIDNRFTYHKPEGSQPERYVALREKAKELAMLIAQTSHESREQSLALTHLQTAVMWANAGIACNG